MSVNIPRTFVFSDGFEIQASQVESELSNVIQIINNANSGLLTWDNIKSVVINGTGLTASTAIASDASKNLVSSTTTAAELAFVHGVTSAIQTQIDGKQASGTYLTNPLGADLAFGSHKGTGLANGTAATDAAAFGQVKIIQTVSAVTTTDISTTSATLQASNTTASITPTSASNKIRIRCSGMVQTNVASNSVKLTIKRGSTDLGNTNGMFFAGLSGSAAVLRLPWSIIHTDSPASTTALTYTVYFSGTDGTNTVQIGSTTTSSIVLEEIA